MPEKKRILMVDDDKDHLFLCKLILQRRGYEVMILSACDGIIEAIESFSPGLIFMDHHMPGISGIETTRMIKSDPSTRHIPVIYFSSCDDIVKAAADAGADAFLQKPFQFEPMLTLLKQFL